jgi:hypothetical protein
MHLNIRFAEELNLLDGHTIEEFRAVSAECSNPFDWTDDPFEAEEEVPEAYTDDEVED